MTIANILRLHGHDVVKQVNEDGTISFPDKAYPCHKCGQINTDWQTFETGWPNNIRYWCLGHIPWRARLKLWWQDRRDA